MMQVTGNLCLCLLLITIWTASSSHANTVSSETALNSNDSEESVALINNGDTSSPGEFPWVAAVYHLHGGGMWRQVCGGTLISSKIVLTAAHCLTKKEDGRDVKKVQEVQVGLGKIYRNYNAIEPHSKILSVTEILIPERYLGLDNWYDLDIGLLILNETVATSAYIMPARMDWLAKHMPRDGDIGYIAGWGRTQADAPSDVLKWASQKYIEYKNCTKMISPSDLVRITLDKICMAKGSGFAGRGDSGGGLTMMRNGSHYVYGVVSVKLSNDSLTKEQTIRLFTNILHNNHIDWLREHHARMHYTCGRSKINPSEGVTLSHGHHISSKGDYPWMAAIYFPLVGKKWKNLCGGTLISPNIVITAANCLTLGRLMETKDVKVGLGKLNVNFYHQEENSIISTVKEIVRPDRYVGKENFFDHDIALLVLSTSVVTGENIMPVCMDWGATTEPKHDEMGYFAGWIMTEDYFRSDVLMWDTLTYVEYNICRTKMIPHDRKLITHDKFCATGTTDSLRYFGGNGGGLTMLRNGTHHLYGIMSTKEYIDKSATILFTNVLDAAHLKWIQLQRQAFLST